MSYTPRLRVQYANEISKSLQEQFGFKSVMRVPKLEKIVLSQGVGDAISDKKLIESAMSDMSLIAGQKAISRNSKKFKFLKLLLIFFIYIKNYIFTSHEK